MYKLALAGLLFLPALRGAGGVPATIESFRQLRFSPDGHYILAQDDFGITILTARPLEVVFRIPAEMAGDAQFTPDSREIAFVSSVVRAGRQPTVARPRALIERSPPQLELLSIAGQRRVASQEIPPCGTQEISPDLRTLACDDFEGTLRIIDIVSGETLFEKKQFVKLIPLYNYTAEGAPDLPNGQFLGDLGEACFDFSPGGRYLKAKGCGGTGSVVVYDLHDRCPIRLGRRLRSVMQRCGSLFVTGGTLLVGDGPVRAKQRVKITKLVDFPAGRILSRPKVPFGQLFRATDPGYVIARPLKEIRMLNPNEPTAAVELSTGRIIASQVSPALDVFERYYPTDRGHGEVGLYELSGSLRATLALHKR